MHTILRTILLAGVILAAIPAWGDDQSSRLPSLDSAPQNMVADDQTMTVTCYLGNPNNRQSLGSVSVNAQAAGSSCNSLYYDCRGRCFGCYSDFDMSEDICVDSSGRKYLH